MYGAIIGDIAGSSYEFSPTKEKDFMMFGPRSRVTDDSVMTVAVAEALLEMGDMNGIIPGGMDAKATETLRVAFAKSMKKWGRRYPDAGYGGRFYRWLKLEDYNAYNSFGNGSAMRVSPAGWVADTIEKTRYIAAVSSMATHDHPEGIKGAESVASAIFLARKGATKEEIRKYIEEEFGYGLGRTTEEIRPGYRFDVTCQGSVPEAIICFLEGEDYEDVIRTAVSLGGDADTQAAIAGSIAEAFYGVPAWMKEEAKDFIPEDMQGVIDEFCGKVM